MIWDRHTKTIFRNDSTNVEAISGLFVFVLSFWCWLFDWFGGHLPKLASYAGWEWLAALVGCTYGLYHMRMAKTRKWRGRMLRSWFLAVALFFFGLLILANRGLQAGAIPAIFLGSFIQVWCVLRVARYRR